MHSEIDPHRVHNVMSEYDLIGEEAFFQKYGGGRAKRYYVVHPDDTSKLYHSATIAQAALGWEDIRGGYSNNYSACSMLERAGFQIIDSEVVRLSSEIEDDLDSISATERLDLVRRRIGQDVLRRRLMKVRDSVCEITGLEDGPLLVASHLKPWASCENARERYDLDNVLLLSALWDAAVDKGLVTFDDDGNPTFSSQLSSLGRRALIKGVKATLWPSEGQCRYLKWHRDNVFHP